MLWATCTICFFVFSRAGEITAPSDKTLDPNDHLPFRDIAVDCTKNPSIIRVKLKRSKTDSFCQEMDVFVGRSYNALCPVSAMLAFLAVREGMVGALFRFQDGECSLGTALWVILEKRCLKQGWMQETTRDTVFAVER